MEVSVVGNELRGQNSSDGIKGNLCIPINQAGPEGLIRGQRLDETGIYGFLGASGII